MSRGQRRTLEGRVGPFLAILASAIFACMLWNVSQGMEAGEALRKSAFNVTSVLTDTGFATDDFSAREASQPACFSCCFSLAVAPVRPQER